MNSPTVRYAFLTAALPRKTEGNGIQLLGWNWLGAFSDFVALVISSGRGEAGVAARFRSDSPVPLFTFPERIQAGPSGQVTGQGFFATGQFLLALPRLTRAIRAQKANRIFALAGSGVYFLIQVLLLQWSTGLPVDLYLVDDFEEWRKNHGQRFYIPIQLLRALERATLRRADRVFAISPGYVEHLHHKYGFDATWLPSPLCEAAPRQVELDSAPDFESVRALVFFGGLNLLSDDALLEISALLRQWNELPAPAPRWRLDLYTYGPPAPRLAAAWVGRPEVRVIRDSSDAERRLAAETAWASLLVYSFAPAVRVMLATSFSTKLSESLLTGRPILFYGPPEAALLRYAREAALPLVATTSAQLPDLLRGPEKVDLTKLRLQYRALYTRYHAPPATRARLLDSLSTRFSPA